jgi:hypothetical protein
MRVTKMQGKLVTGGNVMDKTSERVPKKPEFVHPMMAESLRSSTGKSATAKSNARKAIKRAKQATR